MRLGLELELGFGYTLHEPTTQTLPYSRKFSLVKTFAKMMPEAPEEISVFVFTTKPLRTTVPQ